MNTVNKTAFVCNAHCAELYQTSPEQVQQLEATLADKGYDVRTKGCLSICGIVKEPSDEFRAQAVVNVMLVDGETERKLVAGITVTGNISMMNPKNSSMS